MSNIEHRADESLEDYLETILMLQKDKGQVCSIDIANEMNFTPILMFLRGSAGYR